MQQVGNDDRLSLPPAPVEVYAAPAEAESLHVIISDDALSNSLPFSSDDDLGSVLDASRESWDAAVARREQQEVEETAQAIAAVNNSLKRPRSD